MTLADIITEHKIPQAVLLPLRNIVRKILIPQPSCVRNIFIDDPHEQ